MTDERHVLEIDSWSSRCGSCGKQVLPDEETHAQVSGYGPKEPGCGVRFTHITPSVHYPGIEKVVSAMRPDLIFIGTEFNV